MSQIHLLPFSVLVDKVEAIHAQIEALRESGMSPEVQAKCKEALMVERSEYFLSIGAIMAFQAIEERQGRLTLHPAVYPNKTSRHPISNQEKA